MSFSILSNGTSAPVTSKLHLFCKLLLQSIEPTPLSVVDYDVRLDEQRPNELAIRNVVLLRSPKSCLKRTLDTSSKVSLRYALLDELDGSVDKPPVITISSCSKTISN